jgi:hypothetical protein
MIPQHVSRTFQIVEIGRTTRLGCAPPNQRGSSAMRRRTSISLFVKPVSGPSVLTHGSASTAPMICELQRRGLENQDIGT